MGGTGPRIAPLAPPFRDDSVTEALRRSGMGELAPETLPNGVTTLLHHPRLAGRFLAYNLSLLTRSALPARWRELMVLRVAWHTGSTYEWLQHAVAAGLNDIAAEEVAALAAGAPVDGWPEPEGSLLAATDQLMARHRVDDDVWGRLAARLDTPQLIEVPFVVGTYACLAMAFNSFGMEADADLLQEATKARVPNLNPSGTAP